MTDELKPCPFCGREAVEITYFSYTFNKQYHQVKCGNDDCEMNGFENMLVDDWNTRPIEDDLRKKLDIAVEAMKLANMRLRVNKPNRLEDYVITQGLTEALARLEQK